jgi:HPt (histidine-containing phosphotransfer) domain-containing protein
MALNEMHRAEAPESIALAAYDPAILAALPMVADGSAPHFADQVLETYQAGAAQLLATLDTAARRADHKSYLFGVHQLKSSSAAVGALALAERAANQERDLRAGGTALEEWPHHLRDDYLVFESALTAHRKTLRIVK